MHQVRSLLLELHFLQFYGLSSVQTELLPLLGVLFVRVSPRTDSGGRAVCALLLSPYPLVSATNPAMSQFEGQSALLLNIL